MMKRRLVWFRNDLRVHDHEPLYKASLQREELVPYYHDDASRYNARQRGIVLASLSALRENLRHLGADLLVTSGDLIENLVKVCVQAEVKAVYYHQGFTPQEKEEERQVEQALRHLGVECIACFGNMLFHKEDLPFSISHIPATFTKFRVELERESKVREPFPVPRRIEYAPIRLSDHEFHANKEALLTEDWSSGGEVLALKRLEYYTWKSRSIDTYEETRNGLMGEDYSSRFSVWLALGCLSPRKIYQEIVYYENQNGANKSTYWLKFELMWRDYFRYTALRFGETFFSKEGIKPLAQPLYSYEAERMELWKEGRTGVPFVDAGMRELKQTGFISNRVRQNVASFLIHDLKQPWYLGEEYFAAELMDYDPCNNIGNWTYIAGVGTDPRPVRYFNILHQALTYDKDGEYIRQWLPELKNVELRYLHDLYEWPDRIWTEQGISPGKDYVRPVIKKFWKVLKAKSI